MSNRINAPPPSQGRPEGHASYQQRLVPLKDAILRFGEKDMEITLRVIRAWLRQSAEEKSAE